MIYSKLFLLLLLLFSIHRRCNNVRTGQIICYIDIYYIPIIFPHILVYNMVIISFQAIIRMCVSLRETLTTE